MIIIVLKDKFLTNYNAMKNHLPFLFLLVFIFITSCIRDENSEEIKVSMRTFNYNGEIAEHNHIANWYVGLITEALAAYDNIQHTQSYYELLAWTGLSQSAAYNVKTIDQQTEIYNTYITNLKTEPCKK